MVLEYSALTLSLQLCWCLTSESVNVDKFLQEFDCLGNRTPAGRVLCCTYARVCMSKVSCFNVQLYIYVVLVVQASSKGHR